MHVLKIMFVSVFLLLAAMCGNAQSTDSAIHINTPHSDSVTIQPHISEVNGATVVDSTATASTDTLPKSDTTKVKKHTAKRAVLLSAACPGLGQAYNKKYWKIPIIWAGFGGLGYAIYYTSTNFNQARAVYRALLRWQNPPNVPLPSYNGYSDVEDVKYFRDTYKNYLNISCLVTVIWYGLNLIDAAVDGHLYSYNMDNKLSFNFDPSLMMSTPLGVSQTCLGLSFTINPLAGKRKTALVSF
jgi:hypothetical protein